ncbi:MAG: DUF2085 domain-containing protein [Candidatus Altiarchaeales archaeon]|nr:DUF2085 domain-containing protein [Candidatus Altiarchaeales archaeon]
MQEAEVDLEKNMDAGKIKLSWDARMGPVLFIHCNNKKFGLALCHRQKDRCINLLGHTSLLCARCMGMLAGFISTLLLCCMHSLDATIPWPVSVGLMLPLIVHGSTQFLGLRESNNILRFISGILFVPGFYLTWKLLIF